MPVPTWLSQVLTEQVGRLVDGIVDGKQLCIDPGRAAWLAYLDIYVLDAGAMGFGVLYKGVLQCVHCRICVAEGLQSLKEQVYSRALPEFGVRSPALRSSPRAGAS